jgi:hypothetical protein
MNIQQLYQERQGIELSLSQASLRIQGIIDAAEPRQKRALAATGALPEEICLSADYIEAKREYAYQLGRLGRFNSTNRRYLKRLSEFHRSQSKTYQPN